MRTTVVKKVSFDAAHHLPHYEGKCKNMHGHHWVVELGVEGEVNRATGMVIDFSELSQFLKVVVVDTFDHKVVNDTIRNPTAENIAEFILDQYLGWRKFTKKLDLAFIRVWETEDSYAEVRNE